MLRLLQSLIPHAWQGPKEDEVEVEDLDDEKIPKKKSYKKNAAVEDEEVAAAAAPALSVAAPAAAEPPAALAATEATPAEAAAAAPAPAAAEVEAPAVTEEEEKKAALKEEFNNVTRKGTKLMKASQFERAAECFGRAIEIAETLESTWSKGSLETLYNNRAAMYEKAGMMDASLQDCSSVLAMNASHVKVRKRRARIYQAQGRNTEALVEYCAVLVADTVEMRTRLEPYKEHPQVLAQMQQKIMEEKGAEAMKTQESLQEVMAICGKAKAEEVTKAKAAKKAAGAEDASAPVSESSVFQLLLSYTAYLDAEPASKAASLADLTAAVQRASSDNDNDEGGAGVDAALRARVSALQARAMHHMTKRAYPLASDDLMAAYSCFLAAYPTGSPRGEAAVELADLLRWVALFRHVKYDLDGALAVYDRASELASGDPAGRGLVEVMRSGVYVDKGDLAGAEAAIEKADALIPGSVDLLMHRSQLLVLKPDFAASEVDLRACLALRPDHAVALLRLAMMLIGQAQTVASTGDQAEAEAKVGEAEVAVEKAMKLRPGMSEVYQVLGSIKECRGDAKGAMEAHEKAIALDPKNPTPYINKGMLLAQLQQATTQEEAARHGGLVMACYAKAIEVDPLCSQAQKLLAEMKLRFATQFSETEAIVADLEKAIEQCRDPAELVDLCTFSSIASAQLEAAQDLGMSSFADLNGVV